MFFVKVIMLVLLPLSIQSVFAQTQLVPPEQDAVVSKITYDSTRSDSIHDFSWTTQGDSPLVCGFSFANMGGNQSVEMHNRGAGGGPERDFAFEFKDRARQNILFSITDMANGTTSQFMESYFYFFPRTYLPAIQWPAKSAIEKVFKVILPTGEEVLFNTETKVMMGGVLKETRPLDMNEDRFSRKFAGIEYTGKGVMIRVDRRGNDPRLGTVATISQGSHRCKVSSAQLFDQDPSSIVAFLFPTDEAFAVFLKQACPKVNFTF